jgi:hypothetical protein
MIKNKSDYSILVILSSIYVYVVYRFQTVPKYILISTIVFALSYIIWGIFHHIKARNFHGRIVLEYLLVALLGVAIVSTLLF